ncbi:hypothetical protein BO70DRAFT_145377 [Aspergillus heteromorphus CBS 117.55]|uniref:Uncharacterized protein n=1 Tax=Aspergillus heteromorphus CBS 117.55 TaxID=1448321 RepID=A0A317V9M9_9EURO|nr:uncharacterized protein BO70DRAFT_145377 [Aspergillus heteromorphus CBS 117.55]PWY69738.1 hypothetical protein BO70DRAFT_145377 [Aspergillus heteromorphus CBS 117.55]
MSIGKIIAKIIIIPILIIVFICYGIYLLLKHRRERSRERREDKVRSEYYRGLPQFQVPPEHQHQYQNQNQNQNQIPHPGAAVQWGSHKQMQAQAHYYPGAGDESMMKKPEPVVYPVQAQGAAVGYGIGYGHGLVPQTQVVAASGGGGGVV